MCHLIYKEHGILESTLKAKIKGCIVKSSRIRISMFFIFAALPFSVQAKQVCMNIYIHGIISIKPHITVTNFIRFLTDNVKESIYAETV